MALTPGTRIGPYEIVAVLGAGGMGVVYKATDTRLARTVAIKVLPDHVACDPELKQRFEREARTLAALSHPHICPVFDVGSQEGLGFLVMEYLEGETLEQRLQKGALPLDHALQIGIQIADALAAAHRAGIVHRDLKPGNIILTESGAARQGSPQAKLLDFGLAKSAAPAVVGSLTMAPTTPPNLTAQGAILGTLQYMAPEQLEGREADARTDIFAFGAVLYEMVTGKKAFEASSQASLIAAILERDPPPVSAVRPSASAALDRLVKKCLAKHPDARWQTASDLKDELAWEARDKRTDAHQVPKPRQSRFMWAAVLLLTAVAGALLAVVLQSPAPSRELRVNLSVGGAITPGTLATISFALSPDETQLAYVASDGDVNRLWVRPLSTTESRVIAGTDRAVLPFWAPDSRALGFFADGSLKIVNVDDGSVRTVAGAGNPGGGTWNADGTILYSPNASLPIRRITVTGGEPTDATRLQAGAERNHRFPQFLPDGRHFLYFASGTPAASGIYFGDLDAGSSTKLFEADTPAIYVAPGYLMFARDGTLFAQRFDTRELQLRGTPVRVDDGGMLITTQGEVFPAVSAASIATIAFRPATSDGAGWQWLEVTRAGTTVRPIGNPVATVGFASLAPDGTRLVLGLRGGGNVDVWLMSVDDGQLNRFTFDSAADLRTLWSPDGSRIVFDSNRKGTRDLYQKPADGSSAEQLLLATAVNKYLNDWSPDGRLLLYHTSESKVGQQDIMGLPVDGSGKPFPLIQTPSNEEEARFSPDGRWIAYTSVESGREEIYVQPFPLSGGRFQISNDGGSNARWSRDGRELFYLGLDRHVTAVPMAVSSARSLEIGTPRKLFALSDAIDGHPYFSLRNGNFLTARQVGAAGLPPLTVILNWTPPVD